MTSADHHDDHHGPDRSLAAAELLSDSLSGLLTHVSGLRSDVRASDEARRKSNRIYFSALAMISVLVLAVLVIGYQNNKLAHEVRRTNTSISSCLTPGETCYERGRQRTEGAVSAVVRISVFVSECGRLWPGESGPDYDRKLEACVLERIQRAAAQPSPSSSATPAR